ISSPCVGIPMTARRRVSRIAARCRRISPTPKISTSGSNARGKHPLPCEYRQPIGILEQLTALIDEPSMRAEVLHLLVQRVGNMHRPAVFPQGCIPPLARLVMQDQKVTDALKLVLCLPVIFVNQARLE